MSRGFDHNCKVSACMVPITPKSRGAFDLLDVMKSIQLSSYQSAHKVYHQTSKCFRNHVSYQCCNLLHVGAHVVILCSHRNISFMLLLGTERFPDSPLLDLYRTYFINNILNLLSVTSNYFSKTCFTFYLSARDIV